MADAAGFWNWCAAALRQAKPLVLMVVAATQGSSPAKTGAKMALTADGSAFGTIGGGAIEHAMIKKAMEMLSANETEPHLCREYHDPSRSIETSGMVCGGAQTILLYPCQTKHVTVVEQLAACCAERREAFLCLSSENIALLPAASLQTDYAFTAGLQWKYLERLGVCNHAYIIGGGHVSLALSQVLALLDFDITVLEVRPDLDTLRNNHYARHQLLRRYEDLGEFIPEGARQFVFIMTHSHQHDQLAIEQLAEKQYRYLGVLGSRTKIARMQENLAARVNPQWLQTLRAPMGLPVGSHTPAEIAVSIAAEIVQILNAASTISY